MKFRYVMILCLILLMLCGCTVKNKAPDIAASTLPVYEFTSRICQGTDLTVSKLITENVSCLHDYSLQVNQMRMIEGSDVVILSGAGLEEFMEDALQKARFTIDASEGIPLVCGHHAEESSIQIHDHGHESDPHIWLSPANAIEMALNIHAGLLLLYPEHKATFDVNLSQLLTDLTTLQEYGQETLADLDCRNIITFHDGFGYLAKEYALNILEAVEEESGSEASASEIIHLINLVNDYQLPGVFTEINGSTAAASIIAAETDVKCQALDMALSGESYFDAMYYNFDCLREVLQ